MNQEIYTKMSKAESSFWWFKSRRQIIEKTLKHYIKDKSNLNILEVGSGTGGNIKLLKKYGNLDLIECNDEAIKLTKENYKITPTKYKLPDTNLNLEKKYDVIVMLDVIEHIENDKEILNNLKPFLNDNGIFLMTVPAYQWLWSNHDIKHYHKRRYTIKSFKNRVLTGFNIEYISYFNFFLSPLIILVRLLSLQSNNVEFKKSKINIIFEKIFSFENKFIPKYKFPFGISIISIVKK